MRKQHHLSVGKMTAIFFWPLGGIIESPTIFRGASSSPPWLLRLLAFQKRTAGGSDTLITTYGHDSLHTRRKPYMCFHTCVYVQRGFFKPSFMTKPALQQQFSYTQRHLQDPVFPSQKSLLTALQFQRVFVRIGWYYHQEPKWTNIQEPTFVIVNSTLKKI